MFNYFTSCIIENQEGYTPAMMWVLNRMRRSRKSSQGKTSSTITKKSEVKRSKTSSTCI